MFHHVLQENCNSNTPDMSLRTNRANHCPLHSLCSADQHTQESNVLVDPPTLLVNSNVLMVARAIL
eukprot:2908496-Amphidinium_carterae.1